METQVYSRRSCGWCGDCGRQSIPCGNYLARHMKTILSVACIGVFAVCQPAKADPLSVQVTGVVTIGSDDGVFLPTFGTFNNTPFTAAFTIDPSLASFTQSGPTFQQAFGGTFFGPGFVSPVLSATLTINNITFDFATPVEGSIKNENTEVAIESNNKAGTSLFIDWLNFSNPHFPTTFSPYALTFDAAAGDTDNFSSFSIANAAGFEEAHGNLHATSITLTTPLPAALPLFATGLGALGLLGWRRKGRVIALSAE